jgi:Leucine-rich repeat (LRR) protein
MPMMRRLHPSDVLGGSQFDATQITILRQMASHSLRHVDFAPFVNLEELNLAHNQLTDITKLGIDQLRKLRVLALHHNQLGNPLEQVAQFLDGFQRLECVALRNNPCMKSPAERTRLIGLMRSLHKARCSLRVLDTEISIKERVAAWAQLGGSAEATERLRFEAVMYQRLPPDVPPERIESLDLTDSGMRTIDVTPYAALTCLLLNGNALTTLVGVGLETPQRLKVLDLRNNQLTNLVEVAKLVSNLPRLATLGVAGNPWATRDKSGYRHALLQLMPQLAERECALKVIDEERIGADEIIAASKASKLVTTDKHLVRFQVLMLTRVPSGYRPSDITELNLSKAQLDTVDLGACPLLVKLSLARNELKSLKSANLHRLVRLRALDVSHNQLKDVTEFAAVLALLPRLAVLLWVQNPIAGSPNSATPSAAAPKVSGAKALLPLGTLSSSQLAARESLFTKLAARRMGFNNADDVHSVPLVKSARRHHDRRREPAAAGDRRPPRRRRRAVRGDEERQALQEGRRRGRAPQHRRAPRRRVARHRAHARPVVLRLLVVARGAARPALAADAQSVEQPAHQARAGLARAAGRARGARSAQQQVRRAQAAAAGAGAGVPESARALRRERDQERQGDGAGHRVSDEGVRRAAPARVVRRRGESVRRAAQDNQAGAAEARHAGARARRHRRAGRRRKAAKKATIRIQRAPTAPVASGAERRQSGARRRARPRRRQQRRDDDRPVAAYAGYDLGYMTMGLDMINH